MSRRSRADVRLTRSQVIALRWAADGKTSDEAAQLMGTSKKAVDAHVSRAMDALGAATRAGVVALALRTGIIK